MAIIFRTTAPGMKLWWGDVNISVPDEPHPLAGMECELVRYMGMARSGYDVLVRMPAAAAAEAMARHARVYDTRNPWTADQYMKMFAEQDWLKGDYVEFEANGEDELLSLAQMDAAKAIARAVYANYPLPTIDDSTRPHAVQETIDELEKIANNPVHGDYTRNMAGAVGRALAAYANGR